MSVRTAVERGAAAGVFVTRCGRHALKPQIEVCDLRAVLERVGEDKRQGGGKLNKLATLIDIQVSAQRPVV